MSLPERYVEVADDGSWHWPGLGADAAEMLADRAVRGVGIDTIGLDGGHVAMTLAAHRAVLGTGAFILENLANLADVPPRDTFVIAAPIKIRYGSGGPSRVYAFNDVVPVTLRRFEGQVAAVTGGASGIGAATARR